MQRILSAHLWRSIKAQASKSRNRKVAVAYVTKDLIGFRKGDTLVIDASAAAVSAGETNAKLLTTLHRRGVILYSRPGLHAKVLLLDEVAVIGSGNMSESSRSTLVEVALMTDSPHAVSGVDSFIHQLIEQSCRLDREALIALGKIKVTRRGGRAGDTTRRSAKISPLDNQTWLVGVYELLKTTDEEDRWVERNKETVAKKYGADADEVDWIRWGKTGPFVGKSRPGDQLIQIWRKTEGPGKHPTTVLRAVPLLDKRRRLGVTYAFLGERKGSKSEISWGAFKKMMQRLGAAPGGPTSERILSPDLAEAINRSWKTI